MADKFINSNGLQAIKTWIVNKLNGKVNTTDIATDSAYGIVKTNSDESVYLNEDGQLKVGGRLGQFPTTTGIYAPNDRTPRMVNDYAFMITEAKNYAFEATKSFGVLTGAGITCVSATAGSTTYYVNNNYANRCVCKVLEDGYLALNEDEAKLGNLKKITSVLINGQSFTPDSSANGNASSRIAITVEETVNPNSATTSIRGYAKQSAFSSLVVGQNVSQGGGGASAVIGASLRNDANWCMLVGNGHYNTGSRSAIFGTNNINVGKQNCFIAGQGHDITNGSNGVSALGLFSLVDSNTAFAVGNGTSHTARSNALEVTKDSGVVLKSPNGTRYKITVDNSGNLTTTAL